MVTARFYDVPGVCIFFEGRVESAGGGVGEVEEEMAVVMIDDGHRQPGSSSFVALSRGTRYLLSKSSSGFGRSAPHLQFFRSRMESYLP